MKKMGLTVATVGIFLLSVSGLRAGNFSGSDDFTGTTIDAAKWDDTLALTGFGAFTQANSQLELDLDYDGGGSSYVNSHLPWKLNYGSYIRDWEVYYEVEVPSFCQFSGEESSQLGISIGSYPVEVEGSSVSIALEQGTDGAAYRKFIADIDGTSHGDEIERETSYTESSLRIRWDASETTIFCDYDEGGGADSWSNLGSWNISTGNPCSWDMTNANNFICVLSGGAEINHTGESNPSGDNFVAAGAYPEAPLALFRPATGLWALRGMTRTYFGVSSDTPVYSDYNGDGTKDIAIFRRTTGLWALRGITRAYFGGNIDEPIPGDYNDDGNSDIAIFRESSGLWAVRGLTRGYFGTTGDIPLEP